MANYKLIACDLDGTLLKNDMSISEENLAGIDKLSELDVIFVPVTGRTYNEIPEVIRDNKNIRYVAYSNGSAIIDKVTGEKITHCIPHEICAKVLDLYFQYDVSLLVHFDGNSYVDEVGNDSARYKDEYHMSDNFVTLIKDKNIAVENFKEFCGNMDEIEMICSFFRNEADGKEFVERVKSEIPELEITSSHPRNVEVYYKESSKGNAVKALAQSLEIDIKDVIGIGDSPNDSALLSSAGIGLAVENAVEGLKEIADEIICTNEENIIPYIVENYLINEFPEEAVAPVPEEKNEDCTPSKTKKAPKIIGLIATVAIILAIAISIALGGGDSAIKVGYSGSATHSSWTGTYDYLDGEMNHTITVNGENGILRIAVTTDEGELSIEITDDDGEVIFKEESIDSETFEIAADGKVRIKITGEAHKGSFVIGN